MLVAEPEGSILNGGEPGPHGRGDWGRTSSETLYTFSFEADTISDNQAFKRTRELAEHQGVLVGSSSGAALEAALREAEMADESAHIVTVFPDGANGIRAKAFMRNLCGGKRHSLSIGGIGMDAETGAVTPPIHPASTFKQKEFGNFQYEYGRTGNPTRHALEVRLLI